MDKIVRHPLYIRCQKVMKSCKTKEQLATAFKYLRLAEKKTDVKLTNNLNNLEDFIEHLKSWGKLRIDIDRRLNGIR